MKTLLSLIAFAGFVAVALGAFGAHALKDTLAARGSEGNWNTAVLYHLVHAVAALTLVLKLIEGESGEDASALGASGVRSRSTAVCWWTATCRLWLLGITCFSGSLYWIAVGGPKHLLWPVTPLGGLFFLAGWTCLGVGAWRRQAKGAAK